MLDGSWLRASDATLQLALKPEQVAATISSCDWNPNKGECDQVVASHALLSEKAVGWASPLIYLRSKSHPGKGVKRVRLMCYMERV